jgi:hypothetical protein
VNIATNILQRISKLNQELEELFSSEYVEYQVYTIQSEKVIDQNEDGPYEFYEEVDLWPIGRIKIYVEDANDFYMPDHFLQKALEEQLDLILKWSNYDIKWNDDTLSCYIYQDSRPIYKVELQ